MFAELLAWSNFSFLRAASHPEELVDQAHAFGLSALGLCDRLGIYGAVRAWVRAKEIGQRLLVGAELPLVVGDSDSDPERQVTVALYPEDALGYQHLCQLLTRAHSQRPQAKARVDLAELAAYLPQLAVIVPADSLLALDLHPGPGGAAGSSPLLELLRSLSADRTWLAAYRYLDGGDVSRERAVQAAHHRWGFPILASARPRWHLPERKMLADVLGCIRRKTTLEASGTLLFANTEACLRSESEMRARFYDHLSWLERTGEVVDRCHFDLGSIRYTFPCALEPGETASGKLRRLSWQGAEQRYPAGIPESVRAQLNRELDLIDAQVMAPYFLSAWEVVELARARHILCQGRGSAANSAVCFVLGITAVDPARSNLLFERFMSVERQEPPDIDIDFEHERREEVIQDIYARYGRDRAAMVSEVIRYRPKSALRDVGKVLGLSLDQIEQLSGSVTRHDGIETVRGKLGTSRLDPEAGSVARALRLAETLQHFPRHLSIHVGGFVLSAEPLSRVAPVEPARMPGRTVIPWDKNDLEELGFFKIDVLGLGMLSAIRKALVAINESGALGRTTTPKPDPIELLARIPAEDPEVYRMAERADTIGVFQIESRAQMAMLPRLRPTCFYDLVIQVAIVRPGPIHGKMVHPYLCRRTGEAEISYPHPALEPVLRRTLGVPLFQEQAMQIAIVGAGYSGGEADQLRRDMATWGKNGRLLRHRERLLRGFHARGISPEFGRALFEQLKGFGEYGFPESHAASFALLVYASAWLKCHFSAHFGAALLNSQPMGFYSPHSIVRDLIRHGVVVKDVDVRLSQWDATVLPLQGSASGWALRLGLRLVRGLGLRCCERLIRARTEATFRDLYDLQRRAGLDREKLEALAEAGALGSLVISRRLGLWWARRAPPEGLFRDLVPEAPSLPWLGAWGQLMLDYESKGLSLDDHPLFHLRAALLRRGVLTAERLAQQRHGARTRVAGMVLCRQRPMTANGILFITLEDETGTINLIVRPEAQERHAAVLRGASLLLAKGKVERTPRNPGAETAVVHVLAEHFERLDRSSEILGRMSRDFR